MDAQTNVGESDLLASARALSGPEGADTEAVLDTGSDLTRSWLAAFRWAALTAQTSVVGLAVWRGWLPNPTPVVVLIAAGVLSNVTLICTHRRPRVAGSDAVVGSVLLLDVILLTAMLMLSGGPSNPFTVVYLIHVTLAAVTLSMAWVWIIVFASVCGYAGLFLWHMPLNEHVLQVSGLPSHLAGMWLAFAATAGLIAFFVAGVRQTLVRRERELTELRHVAARHERLASLMTLAAGAAHELATPLASIAVAAREIERATARGAHAVLREDAQVIRSQVDRCRVILDQMSGRASQKWIERPSHVAVAEVIGLVREGLPADRTNRLRYDADPHTSLVASKSGLAQALLTLVGNAFDASAPDAEVWLRVRADSGRMLFVVRDTGSGMPADVLARAGEPFFSTKPPGRGYGLGLFLVRLFADGHRGHLWIDSTEGRGSTVTLELPSGAISS